MRRSSALVALLCASLLGCKGEKLPEKPSSDALENVMKLFRSSLEQLLSYKRPADLYAHQFGRFTLDSQSTLSVRKNDVTREFTGYSKLEMDRRGNFKLLRKTFFQDQPVEVMVVGSEALYRAHPSAEFRRMTPDPEFAAWARASVAEIFSTYDQTDFVEQSEETASGSRTCRKSPNGELCLDPASSLPVSGRTKVDVSGDRSAEASTVMTLEFSIVPHSQGTELLLLPEQKAKHSGKANPVGS